jgi:EamA-like transporter family
VVPLAPAALAAGRKTASSAPAALLLVALSLGQLDPTRWSDVSWTSAGAAVFLLVFDSLVGFMLYTRLLESAPAPLVSTYAYVTPLVGAVIGATVLDEPLWAGAFVGGALVSGAVALELRRPAGPASANRGNPTAQQPGTGAGLSRSTRAKLTGGRWSSKPGSVISSDARSAPDGSSQTSHDGPPLPGRQVIGESGRAAQRRGDLGRGAVALLQDQGDPKHRPAPLGGGPGVPCRGEVRQESERR